jgi:hypothetical protein
MCWESGSIARVTGGQMHYPIKIHVRSPYSSSQLSYGKSDILSHSKDLFGMDKVKT